MNSWITSEWRQNTIHADAIWLVRTMDDTIVGGNLGVDYSCFSLSSISICRWHRYCSSPAMQIVLLIQWFCRACFRITVWKTCKGPQVMPISCHLSLLQLFLFEFFVQYSCLSGEVIIKAWRRLTRR